jgi:hypothetical protein
VIAISHSAQRLASAVKNEDDLIEAVASRGNQLGNMIEYTQFGKSVHTNY